MINYYLEMGYSFYIWSKREGVYIEFNNKEFRLLLENNVHFKIDSVVNMECYCEIIR